MNPDRSKSLSAQFGIPAAIPINNHKRYSFCDANEALLEDVTPDGRIATYRGVCSCRHTYMEKFQVEELRRKTKVVIESGEYVNKFSEAKVNSDSAGLEEY